MKNERPQYRLINFPFSNHTLRCNAPFMPSAQHPNSSSMPYSGSLTAWQYYGGAHSGVDILKAVEDSKAPTIYAPCAATVVGVCKDVTGYKKGSLGNCVMLKASSGVFMCFAHLEYRSVSSSISINSTVKAGQYLGVMGNTGESGGLHLHFEVGFYTAPNSIYVEKYRGGGTVYLIDPEAWIAKVVEDELLTLRVKTPGRLYTFKDTSWGSVVFENAPNNMDSLAVSASPMTDSYQTWNADGYNPIAEIDLNRFNPSFIPYYRDGDTVHTKAQMSANNIVGAFFYIGQYYKENHNIASPQESPIWKERVRNLEGEHIGFREEYMAGGVFLSYARNEEEATKEGNLLRRCLFGVSLSLGVFIVLKANNTKAVNLKVLKILRSSVVQTGNQMGIRQTAGFLSVDLNELNPPDTPENSKVSIWLVSHANDKPGPLDFPSDVLETGAVLWECGYINKSGGWASSGKIPLSIVPIKDMNLTKSSLNGLTPWDSNIVYNPGINQFIVDLSSEDVNCDWTVLSAFGSVGAIVRIGQLRHFKNSGANAGKKRDSFKVNSWNYYSMATAANGFLLGAYVYSTSLNIDDAKEEATETLSLIKDISLPLGVWWRIEDSLFEKDPKKNTDMFLAFSKIIEEAGYGCGICSKSSWFDSYLDTSRFEKRPIWLIDQTEDFTTTSDYVSKLKDVVLWQWGNTYVYDNEAYQKKDIPKDAKIAYGTSSSLLLRDLQLWFPYGNPTGSFTTDNLTDTDYAGVTTELGTTGSGSSYSLNMPVRCTDGRRFTKEQIKRLCDKYFYFKGQEDLLYQEHVTNLIDPVLVFAVAGIESSYGTADTSLVRTYHNPFSLNVFNAAGKSFGSLADAISGKYSISYYMAESSLYGSGNWSIYQWILMFNPGKTDEREVPANHSEWWTYKKTFIPNFANPCLDYVGGFSASV